MNRQRLERIEAMNNLKDQFLEKVFSMHADYGSDIYKKDVLSLGVVKEEIYKIFKKLCHEEVDSL